MSRVQIISGKTVKSGEESPSYVELTTNVTSDQLAIPTVQNVDHYKYLVFTYDNSTRPYYEYSDKVSECTPIIRFSREDMGRISSKMPVYISFKFSDGYIETHTILTPGRFCKIETIHIDFDYKHIKHMKHMGIVEESHPIVNSEAPPTKQLDYYQIIQRVEQKNGAFPCMFSK